jgi:hypothetical protein
MSEKIPVRAARIPDRDRLLGELREAGLDAHPVGEVEIEVPYGDGSDDSVHDVYTAVEGMIVSLGAPFVPIKHDGVIYVRPPIS